MTEDEIIQFVSSLPGVVAITASEGSEAPEVSWGDSFFFYDPDGKARNRQLPFATIVTKDYDGFDAASNLDRPGIFRLNIAVGRTKFLETIGYSPAEHSDHHATIDYTVCDQILPHPIYAAQSWISILNPSEATAGEARLLLTYAHSRAVDRHRARR